VGYIAAWIERDQLASSALLWVRLRYIFDGAM
jgi:hypothetical protein